MRNNIFKTALLVPLACGSAFSAQAQTIFQPRVLLGYTDYQMTVETDSTFNQVLGSRVLASEILGDGDVDSGSTTDISDRFITLGVGMSMLNDDWFADIYLQDSISADFSDANEFAFEAPNRIVDATEISDGKLDRRDAALSIGKYVSEGFSVSAGYKSGVTSFDQVATINGESIFTNYEFDVAGPFAAVGFNRKFGRGVFGVNLALASLTADYRFGTSFFVFDNLALVQSGIEPAPRDAITGSVNGKATGLTLGMSWKAPFPLIGDDDFTYSLRLDSYDYDINLNGRAPVIQPDVLNQNRLVAISDSDLIAEFSESVISFRFEIAYLF